MRRAARVDDNQRGIVDDLRLPRERAAARVANILANGGKSKDAAEVLGVSRATVSRLCKEFGIDARQNRPKVECLECGKVFMHSPSVIRKYCSYACHLASGGAHRAGEAAAMARKKYGAKKDANHKEVFDAIRALTAVHDLSDAGCGVPDGLAWVSGGWQLFDVKNPKTSYGKRGLNPLQKQWAKDWRGGPVFLIYTVDEAIQFARGRFCHLKVFHSDGPEKAIGIMQNASGEIPLKGVIT